MISPALDRLRTCNVALIAALDSDDVEPLEQAINDFERALEAVRAAGSWREESGLIDLLLTVQALTEAAHIRVNFLTDMNQRRMDALAHARGQFVAVPYGQDGRRVA